MNRRKYEVSPIYVNRRIISEVIIDPHYEVAHSESINDELILELVKELSGIIQAPDSRDGNFSYYKTFVDYQDKRYRLIWLMEAETIYILES